MNGINKPKVTIVRGSGLSKWEMQIYEPLSAWFDLNGIGTTRPVNDIEGITFPVKKLFCPGQYVTKLPKSMPVMFSLFGDTQWLVGFDKAVEGADLVHSVEIHNAYTLQAVRAKRLGKVRAVTMRVYETIPYLYDEFPTRKKLKQEVVAGADHFLAANEMARQCLLLEGVNNERISIVPQSVDTRRFRPPNRLDEDRLRSLRKKFGIAEQDFLVLSVGRMVWEKGWYDIIPTAAKIKRETDTKIKFLLIGSGPESREIQNLIHQAGVENVVVFPGATSYRKMPDIFRASNLFLYPPLPTRFWNAQFGGVLIEAMATGIPIVGTLSGGVRDDTVGRGGGIFVQPQHFSGLSDAILRLYEDKSLTERIGKRNRKVAVKKYDTLVVAKKIKTIWEKVLEGS